MDRLSEIRARTIAAGRSKDAQFDLAIHAPEDIPYLLEQINISTARAEAAEAERDACKADLKSMADWYRDSVCDDGICGWCKQDADHGLDGDANECAGFYKNDCFEWRGQHAGKGEQ